MHRAILALALAGSTGVHSAAAQDPAVMATVNQFVSSFNQGDVKAAAATCADQTSIIDEFPPYAWDGAGACLKWMADYDADAKKNGITDGVVTLGAPRHVDISGDRAYVVVPADYEYKQNGQPVKEAGSTLTVALQKSAAGWRITAWSWAKN
jgi:ketosteroid isomerase-like protein